MTSAVAVDPCQPRKFQEASQHWRYRIRKGQKLDEVVQVIESGHASGSAATSAPASNSKQPANDVKSPSTAPGGESPFQLQEYLAMLVRQDSHNVERIVALPSEADVEAAGSAVARKGGDMEEDASSQPVDTDIWVYEQLCRLVLDLTSPWLTSLQQDCDRHARPETCAAMNAGDWMFLCASHGEEKQCCAIDYMVHTLDGATSLLNSARHFPSRTFVPNTSLRHFGSIARRLSRIFVHAWCYHKDVFSACEAETSLYSRFFALIETFDLTATDNLPPPNGAILASTASDARDSSNNFSRGTSLPFAHVNGTTARRDRSSTAAPRTSVVHSLQRLQEEDVGTIPPPAPSPRPTAILTRPDHEEDDNTNDTPSVLSARHEDTNDDDEDDDGDDEDNDDDDKAKMADDADSEPTILLKHSSAKPVDSASTATDDQVGGPATADREVSAIAPDTVVKGLEEGLETSAENISTSSADTPAATTLVTTSDQSTTADSAEK